MPRVPFEKSSESSESFACPPEQVTGGGGGRGVGGKQRVQGLGFRV